MIIRKFKVHDMKEALTRARYELGPDAVIVTQRVVKDGKWFNPFKKRMLEVTFALEDKPVEKEEPVKEPEEEALETFQEALKTRLQEDQVQLSREEEVLPDREPVSIDKDPLYLHAGDDVRKRLESYRMLHNKGDGKLTSSERREFFNIVMKESPFGRNKELSRINVLVGPTGVGKTTTIAKLAAGEHLGKSRKVGLVTMDTYRIGAVQQLKTYAEILQVPFHVANNPEEMKEKLDLMQDCDMILVDTLGTSPKDMNKLVEIKKNLNAMGEGISTYLVLSLSTDRDSIDSILERYRLLKYDGMVITKVDEVENTRNLWHLVDRNTVPVQYFCHGQDVPEDIKEATPENIFKYFEENLNYDGSGWKIKRNRS